MDNTCSIQHILLFLDFCIELGNLHTVHPRNYCFVKKKLQLFLIRKVTHHYNKSRSYGVRQVLQKLFNGKIFIPSPYLRDFALIYFFASRSLKNNLNP